VIAIFVSEEKLKLQRNPESAFLPHGQSPHTTGLTPPAAVAEKSCPN
jgi:hypothetical protein